MISIIVPVYKVEEYLDECVESLVAQTYRDIEIILVDDGSPDRCPQMCESWASKDSRIRVIHVPNGGVGMARNIGIEASKGNFLGFVDSDDFVAPEMYEKLLAVFSEHPEASVASCRNFEYTDGVTRPGFSERYFDPVTELKGRDFILSKVTGKSSISVCNKLFRKELFDDLRFRTGICDEDTMMMYDLGKVVMKKNLEERMIPDRLLYYRQRSGSVCHSASTPMYLHYVNNLETMMGESLTDGTGLHDVLRGRFFSTLFTFLMMLLKNDSWYCGYFSEYSRKARQVPVSWILENTRGKTRLIDLLIRCCPRAARPLYKIVSR